MMEFKTKTFYIKEGDTTDVDVWLNSQLKGGYTASVSGYTTCTYNSGIGVLITVKRWRKESQPSPVHGSQIADEEEPTIN